MENTPKQSNRLSTEKSPYLLQHAHNPVDWFPWSEVAFAKAAAEDKPVFLSIGYSTCHWCHVMADESFSDPEIANVLNKDFVAIKVDREERPDIDNLYMKSVIAVTGTGGWPLTVFLTPDKKPFFGGTYFPPEDRWGRLGLKRILAAIADMWRDKREELLKSAQSIVSTLECAQQCTTGQAADEKLLERAYKGFASMFDATHGGFDGAPKFPTPHNLLFLLRYWYRTNDAHALEMVEKTLHEIARGGICDHLGGGFHRYSTDAQWRLPHFEKMLYDQALLSCAFLEAFQATHSEEFAQTARGTFEFVLREMTALEGGFFSAYDADSYIDQQHTRKKEGAYYVWSVKELTDTLGTEIGAMMAYYFDASDAGNAVSDPLHEFAGLNVLYRAHTVEETAKQFGRETGEMKLLINDGIRRLFERRAQRSKPNLDDKILVDWNGLMLSSLAFGARVLDEPSSCAPFALGSLLAFGARVLDEPRYAGAAEHAAQFIMEHMQDRDGRLLHRYGKGESAVPGMIDDYAFFIHGLLDLYEATWKAEYFMHANRLMEILLANFWDERESGFFFTPRDSADLLFRQKELYDGGVPSGNALAVLDLLRLARYTGNRDYQQKAEASLKVFAEAVVEVPIGHSQMLVGLDFALGPVTELVFSGEEDDTELQRMIREAYALYLPNKITAYRPPQEDRLNKVAEFIPFLKDQPAESAGATTFICENNVCKMPAHNAQELREKLEGKVQLKM